MTLENFETTLEAMMDRRPFTPVTIQLRGGQRFEIDHRHSVVYRTGQGKAIFLAPGGVPIYFDHESVNQIIDAPAHSVP